jgi:hypothetical protein
MKFISKIKQWLQNRSLKKRQWNALASGVEPRKKKRAYNKVGDMLATQLSKDTKEFTGNVIYISDTQKNKDVNK